MGKAFEKQIKTTEDQSKKQVDVLEQLKRKEEAKPIKGKSNNQSRATIIFSNNSLNSFSFVNKGKELRSELYSSVDYNNLDFEYVDPKNNDVSFYEYRDSKELFNAMKYNEIRFDEARWVVK